jgi:hypothetical protein
MFFEVTTECACCSKPIHITVAHDLSYTVTESDASPMFFVPSVDFTKLKAPSIIEDF